ncbi:uncharacterized protein LOC132723001 [Ruditapes philippinarum]|uniref:uncharacterized protein LOC132723001 n=1 Tax=Ruditapes philippinarum TaxID=129788 RepID=UPI00295C0348|nr:uncharacterized protein LOC132723001 [Ruditapes philippinarum]
MKHFAILVIFAAVTMVTGGVLVGAPEKQSTSDRPLRRMAEFAVGELGSEYELVRVVSGTKQVVNGFMYNIELIVKKVIPGRKNQRRRCKVLVYEIRHQRYLELEEFHCHFSKKAPRL